MFPTFFMPPPRGIDQRRRAKGSSLRRVSSPALDGCQVVELVRIDDDSYADHRGVCDL